MILAASYFQAKDTVTLAYDLIGKYLVREIKGAQQAYLITEAEAYDGSADKASHAYRGKTKRNQIMFAPGGVWYVYLCYGIHWLLNIVTGPSDYPAAILIRGIAAASGPGRLTKLLQINQAFYAKPATPDSGLWIEDRGFKAQQIISTPRIGIDYAAEYCVKPWRFLLVK